MTEELESLAKRIQEGIVQQGRYFVSSPAEMAQLGGLPHTLEFAQRYGWMLVTHLGGENYEFFEAVRSPHQALF